ncbi:sarcosine oxidase subunit beta [Deinobacterium chartae]|uniref:Sarcosine oxidase subunit beta n=1 Tax=Deinobacterium chartae TaxID=521158 RepID=A0A841HYN7_9DEIO|nr:FAD-dependent oxidoreductase [Deinobacterium chartae]MBB6097340.1 sarcosine oxidase subunit beta [Deinobacterium chartae]
MNLRPDAVVVGAGIVGAACALRLAERGLRVSVLEQAESPAAGSTARSVAGVRAQFATRTNILLSQRSIAEYAALPEAGYCASGYLLLFSAVQWTAHQAALALQRSLGVPVRALSPLEAQRITPFDPEGIAGCSFCPTDGSVDPHGITFAYLRGAARRGAELHTATPLTAVTRSGGVWRLHTPRGTLEAPLLVNAAGAWSGEVAALAGLDVPVIPARRMVFATGPLGRHLGYPMTFDLTSGVYLRSEGERLILGRADVADSGWREGMNWDWLEPTLEAALARFPWLEQATLDRRASWWGYYEVTPDHAPILGRMPGADGWINACGFSGHGVMHAAAVGHVIAQEALGEPASVNIDALRYERFGQAQAGLHDLQL